MTNNDLIIRMARAMHDGPLGADDHVFDATTAQGNWCMDMARAALDAIDLSELTPTPEQIKAFTKGCDATRPAREAMAKEVYQAMIWAAQQAPPPNGVYPPYWHNGNSHAETEARRATDVILSLMPAPGPTAEEALQAIANLPTPDDFKVMVGQEDAYRAVEGLFEYVPMIIVGDPTPDPVKTVVGVLPYVGSQNDIAYVIDGPPSPAPYDGPIPKEHGPNVIWGPIPPSHEKTVEAVCAALRALQGEAT